MNPIQLTNYSELFHLIIVFNILNYSLIQKTSFISIKSKLNYRNRNLFIRQSTTTIFF